MSQNLAELLEEFLKNSELSIHWIEDNYINLSTGKCLVKNQVPYVNFFYMQRYFTNQGYSLSRLFEA